jgi:hypothetical protein
MQIGPKSKSKTTNSSSKQLSITDVIMNHSSTIELKRGGSSSRFINSIFYWSIEGTVYEFFWSQKYVTQCNWLGIFYPFYSLTSQGRSYPKMRCTQICLKVWWRVTKPSTTSQRWSYGRGSGVNGAKSCILAISWHWKWSHGNPIFISNKSTFEHKFWEIKY